MEIDTHMTASSIRQDARQSVPAWAVTAIVLVVLLAGAGLAPATAEAASLKDQISAAKGRQQELARSIGRQDALLRDIRTDQAVTRAALRDTSKRLAGINADQKRVRRQIDKAKAALARTEARHAVLLSDLRESDYTLGLLDGELRNAETDLKARRAALGLRLAEAYRTENTTLIEQIFTAESFSDVLTDASAYLSYGEQDAQLADQLVQDQQALDSLRLLTTATRLRTDQLRRETEDAADEILKRKQELDRADRRLRQLERKTKRIQDRQQDRYRALVKNEKQAKRIRAKQAAAKASLQRRISGMVRKAQAQAARRSSGLGGSGNGRFIWPTRGTVTQNYGCTGYGLEPPRGSCPGFHDGIDIANAAGTPIRAAADGVVAFIGYRPDGAFVVVIGHAGGFETVYAHMLATYPVRRGQYVKRGQLIGKMGSTGYSTGNHLHWEVSKGFSTVNPRLYV